MAKQIVMIQGHPDLSGIGRIEGRSAGREKWLAKMRTLGRGGT